jgi:uncharacterized protein (TIGR00725 family)
MEDFESIRARALAASAGVWQRHGPDVWLQAADGPLFRGRDGSAVIRAQADRDAEFVAHARADILALLQLAAVPPAPDPDLAAAEASEALCRPVSGPAVTPTAWRAVVAIVGPADASEPIQALARGIGERLAQAGVLVVTGGLDGVMAAATRGATEAGGTVVGLLPGEDRAAGNEYLSISIPTGLGQARNALVVAAADAVIAVGGSWGTLTEIALAHRTGVPVISLSGWAVTNHEGAGVPIRTADSADEALTMLGQVLGWTDSLRR